VEKNLKNKQVLVTGASGFTGSWLTEYLLESGANVTTILAHWNPNTHYVGSGLLHKVHNVIGDLSDYDLIDRVIKENGISTVFHLAAVSIEKLAFNAPRIAFEVNVRGTYNLLEACRNSQDLIEKVIVASSDKAYGDSPHLPYTEDMPLIGRHPYDCSKSCQDLISQSYAHSYGLPVAIGRFGNIYGGGDPHWSRLIPGTIRRFYKREAPIIRLPKVDNFKRDYLYIKDLIQSYMALYNGLDRPEVRGQAFNFAMGGSWTVLEVVNLIAAVMNCSDIEPVFVQTDHGEILHQKVSVQKAAEMLNWRPQYTLEQGIAETAQWYCKYFENPVLPGNDINDLDVNYI